MASIRCTHRSTLSGAAARRAVAQVRYATRAAAACSAADTIPARSMDRSAPAVVVGSSRHRRRYSSASVMAGPGGLAAYHRSPPSIAKPQLCDVQTPGPFALLKASLESFGRFGFVERRLDPWSSQLMDGGAEKHKYRSPTAHTRVGGGTIPVTRNSRILRPIVVSGQSSGFCTNTHTHIPIA